jgi:hypothetical protein
VLEMPFCKGEAVSRGAREASMASGKVEIYFKCFVGFEAKRR